ncbi:hypothetical protein AB0K48_49280 [Nonomuraea sp. NPDC055795]
MVEADGVLKPKVSKAAVAFSAGGAGKPFATLGRRDGQSVALSWPTALPKPQIEGNKATYAGVAGPMADLVVTATGFRHDVILRRRPDKPVAFRIPVTTTGGLKLSTTKTGGLTLTDAKGQTVAAADEPYIMEATAAALSGGPEGAIGEIETTVVAEKDGAQSLVLKPDAAFLADTNTRYPVTIDPTVGLTVTQDATYNDDGGTGGAGAYLFTGTAPKEITIQDCSGSTCSWRKEYKAIHSRSAVQFGGFSFAGRAIVDAHMQVYGRTLPRRCGGHGHPVEERSHWRDQGVRPGGRRGRGSRPGFLAVEWPPG